jgi:hypothetical protein
MATYAVAVVIMTVSVFALGDAAVQVAVALLPGSYNPSLVRYNECYLVAARRSSQPAPVTKNGLSLSQVNNSVVLCSGTLIRGNFSCKEWDPWGNFTECE